MISFPELKLPEVWKPLFKSLDDLGWKLAASHGPQLDWHCRELLSFHHESGLPIVCYLSFLNEPEWCGNNFNNHALTIAAFSWIHPESRADAEMICLPMTGDWESELTPCMEELDRAFLNQTRALSS